MPQANVEVLREAIDAINSWDVEVIVALSHPEFEAVVPPQFSTEPDTYRGPEGIRRYFESFEAAMDEINYHPESLWDAGDSVVVAVRLTAKGRHTSIPVEQRFAHVWELHEGRLRGVRTYATPDEALAAVGLAG
jgi:ketosteroid isomerase-like protein